MSDQMDALEMGAWAEIQAALTEELLRTQAQHSAATKSMQRVSLETERLMALNDLLSGWAIQYHQSMAKFLTSTSSVHQSNEAVRELLAWQDILQSHPLPMPPNSIAEKEQALTKAMNNPEADRLDLERRRAEEMKRDADRQLAEAVGQLTDLKREKKALESQVATLAAERDAFEKSIYTLRMERMDEQNRLDAELKDLRNQIRIERDLLDNLRAANNVQAVAQVQPLREYGTAAASPPPLYATGEVSPYQPSTSVARGGGLDLSSSYNEVRASPVNTTASSSPNREHTPSLSSGLKALQNVREQLRDIRENHTQASASLMRAASTYTIPSHPAASSPELHRSSTAAAFSTSSASPNRSAVGDDAASPWKQRLAKLQGDLRLLKAELGTSL